MEDHELRPDIIELSKKHNRLFSATVELATKKNDNCYVEYKNFIQVRKLFDYQRFKDPCLVDLMDGIYFISNFILALATHYYESIRCYA